MKTGQVMAMAEATLRRLVSRMPVRFSSVLAALALMLVMPVAVHAQATTTTTLAASPSPSAYGQNVALTATVAGSSPSGTVTFLDGTAALGAASLAGTAATGTVTFAVSSLAVGTHSLTAVYAGDANNTGSTSAAVSQVVNPAGSTTTIAASPNPSTYLSTVTFTATVTGQGPTGAVSFKDGTTVLGTASLSGSGNTATASFAASSLSVASHSITAVYAGDANNNTSTSAALSEVVNKAATTTTVGASTNPGTYSQTVTFTASVSGVAGPTGSVTFMDGSNTLVTATLSGGSASYSTSALTVGSHSITAVYGGDTNSNTSTSATLSQVINTDPTAVSLTSAANPSTAGQSTTLTATVTGATPTGNVTFQDGSTVLGTKALSAGSASLSVGALAAGTHNLTAAYAGDSHNGASTSAALSQSVGVATTNMTLSVPQSSATLGQNVTLMAKVNGFIPSGVVTFTDGGSSIGTALVQGGAATLSVNGLAVGSHTLAASYPGDSNNTSASAANVGLTVVARAGYVWQYGYDAMGRLNTVVDPNAQATYTYYDSLGRPIQTQQPPNTGSSTPTVTQYGYDAMDSLTSVADPRNLSTTYSKNGLGQSTAQSSPDSGNSSYTYDAKGNVLSSTDARGKTTTFAYDALDRMVSASYPSGTTTTFEYDGGANPTPAASGELTKMADESGQTVYGYDSAGRLISKTVTIGTRTFTVGYTWGDSGTSLDKLTAITYPSGNQVNYSYDQYGSVSGITVNPVNPNGQGTSGTATTLLSGITYNADNKVTGWLWSDGKARTIGYDRNGLVSSYNLGDPLGTGATAGLLRTLTRDAAGRVTGYTHTNNGAAASSFDQSFGYDNLDRLTSDTQASTTTQYSYDATGNRTAKTIGGTTYTNSIDPASNRLAQVQDVTGTVTISHDAAGNIVGDGSFTYTYSDRGRMASATTSSGTVSYVYNGLGQRAQKSGPTSLVASGASYYVYDEAGQLLGEYDVNGSPVYETIYLGSLPTGVLKETGTAATNDIAVAVYNVHADQIAAPRVITAQDEAIVWRWDGAEAFGATAPDQNPNGQGTFVFNQRFPGQVFDAETGLFQNWNRDYNARTGRYEQSDPTGLADGVNTFLYAHALPVRQADPRGLWGVGGIVGGGAEAGAGPVGLGFNLAAGFGLFGGGKDGLNLGGFLSKAFFPAASKDTQFVGGYTAGVGAGVFVTNATRSSQLCGISHQVNVNLPFASFSFSWDDTGTFVVSGTRGPAAPYSTISISSYPSVTYKPF